jgi:hypothetical protein
MYFVYIKKKHKKKGRVVIRIKNIETPQISLEAALRVKLDIHEIT